MRQLLGFLLTVIVAVAITLFAQGNAAKVAIFVGQKRIDLSLNFAIIVLCVSFFFVHVSLLAIRVSGQLPNRFKTFFSNRTQHALLQANTHGLIALIAKDEQGAEKALKQALGILQGIDAANSKLPSVHTLRLFVFIGLNQWTDALTAYQACFTQLNQVEHIHALNALTEGLTRSGKLSVARQLIETVLFEQNNLDALPAYRHVVMKEPKDELPCVEKLLNQHPEDCRLIELAGDVCEHEQLWDKAIAHFERAYAKQATAPLANKLSRVYGIANQADKAQLWKDKSNALYDNASELM